VSGENSFMELDQLLQFSPAIKVIKQSENELVLEIIVRAKPGSKKERIEISADFMIVAVNARPIDGEANERIREYVAKSLGIAKRDVLFISGEKGKSKRFQVSFHFTDHKDIKYYLEKWSKVVKE